MNARQLGNFRLEEEAGRGATGVVYRALQLSLGRPAAVKVLHPSLLLSDQQKRRFEREAKTIAALAHPNIIAIYDAHVDEESAWFAMEWCSATLADEMARGPLPARRAIETARCVSDALVLLHEQGILHRDIKPSNVLVTANGAVKLSDFGLALAAADERLTGTGHAVGTKRYLAPEILRGAPADVAADVYALGVLLFEMLTGAPMPTESSPPREAAHKALHEIRPEISDWVVAVVQRATAAEPDDRFPDAAELRDALDLALADPDLEEPSPSTPAEGHRFLDGLSTSVDLFIMRHVDEGRGLLGRLRRRASLRVRGLALRFKEHGLLKRASLADALARQRRLHKRMRRLERLRRRLAARATRHATAAHDPAETKPAQTALETTLSDLEKRGGRERSARITEEVARLDRELASLGASLESAQARVADLRESIDLDLARRTRRRHRTIPALVLAVFLALVVAAVIWRARPRETLAPGPVQPLHAAREHAQGCALSSGAAVIVGGIDTSADPSVLDTIEVYEGPARRFRLLAVRLPRPTFNHALTPLDSGRVLVTGGEQRFEKSAYREAVLLDIPAGSAKDVGLMTYGRRRHQAVRLADGRLFVVGGEDEGRAPDHSVVERFDPATGAFTLVARLPGYVQDTTATPLPDGRVAIIGGQDRAKNALSNVLVFDPRSDSVDKVASLRRARYEHTATLLQDGRIVVAGGFAARGKPLTDVEIVDTKDFKVTEAAPMSCPRAFHRAARTPDGGVLVTGGRGGKTVRDTIEIYDPQADQWRPAGETLARNNHVLVELAPGRFLIVGGYAGREILRDAEILAIEGSHLKF